MLQELRHAIYRRPPYHRWTPGGPKTKQARRAADAMRAPSGVIQPEIMERNDISDHLRQSPASDDYHMRKRLCNVTLHTMLWLAMLSSCAGDCLLNGESR